jgi:hypothetical protein
MTVLSVAPLVSVGITHSRYEEEEEEQEENVEVMWGLVRELFTA